MKTHQQELKQMPFEQILNFISERPKQLLSQGIDETPDSSATTMYDELKAVTKNMRNMDYVLGQLEKEFLESLKEANHQKNKQPP